MAYTVAQLNTMTPQARASYYVDNLTAAQKRGPLTAAQSAELKKYRTVAARPAAAAAPTMITAAVPPQSAMSAGQYQTALAGGANAGALSAGYLAANPYSGPAIGQAVDLSGPSGDTYTLAAQWAYAIANPAAAVGTMFANANAPSGVTLADGTSPTYGQFQLGQLVGQIKGQGPAYWGGYPTPPTLTGAAGAVAADTAARQRASTVASGVYVPAVTQAPAGGNASSLVPAATQTSNVTPQGSGTQNATAPTDTGTGAAVTSGASAVTGAGGGYDAGYSTTGTTTGGSGLTTADMALIAIGAGGLLLAMRKKGKG